MHSLKAPIKKVLVDFKAQARLAGLFHLYLTIHIIQLILRE